MKKKFLFFLIVFFVGIVGVSAKEIDFYFYPNGGKVKTNGFSLGDYGYLSYNGNFYSSYSDSSTIKSINSIKGKKFTISKSGDSLVSGREWYMTNINDGKVYFFSESKKYKVSKILDVLGSSGEGLVSIDLYANWSKKKIQGLDMASFGSTVKAKDISISSSKSQVEIGSTLNLSIKYNPINAEKQNITWISSDKKIATINSNGKVSGLKTGTVVITAKSSSGLKATKKITVVKATPKTVFIRLNTNHGTLLSNHGKQYTIKSGNVYVNGSINVHKISYGESMNSYGLLDYNHVGYLNLDRKGYTIVNNKEWNTKPDGSGKSFSQFKVYKAKDFCDASKKNCVVTLYANWKKSNPKRIKLATFNMGYFFCGRSFSSCKASPTVFTNLIKNNNIDIIGLQESRTKDYYHSSSTRTKSNETIFNIGKNTGLKYHYMISPYNVDTILSKYKLRSNSSDTLPSCGEKRAIQKTIIRINGVDISYYNTHVSFNRINNTDCAAVHLAHISKMLKTDRNPIILTGDFNRVAIDNYVRYLRPLGFVVAAHDTKLNGKEGENSYMDSVFVLPRNHIDVVSQQTILTYGKYSDHNMVIATLDIK